MARNDHKSLENSQIHPPKDFATASSGDVMRKNLNDELDWGNNYWKPAVLDLADINATPPTEVDGDRYIVIEVASTVADAAWDGATVNQIVEYSSTSGVWAALTPTEGDVVYDKDSNNYYKYDGADWMVIISATGEGDFADGGEAEGKDRTLGNTDNYDLGFLTNNQTRIHIQNDGKIGIGTTTPTNLLHLLTTTTGTDPQLLFDNSGNGDAGFRWELSGTATGVQFDFMLDYSTNNLILSDDNAGALMTFSYDNSTLDVESITTFNNEMYAESTLYGQKTAGGRLELSSTDNATKGKIFFGTAQTSAWDEVNDRLGVGTNAPSKDLHVNGGASVGEAYIGSTISANGSNIGILSFVGNDSGANLTEYAQIIGHIDTNTDGDELGELIFQTQSGSGAFAERLRLDEDGRAIFGASGLSDASVRIKDSSGNVDIDLNPNGLSTFENGLDITGNSTFQDNLTVNGILTISSSANTVIDALGEIQLDSNGDGSTITTGVLVHHDGTQKLYNVSTTNYPSSDNDVPAYDSATNSVTWQAQAGGASGLPSGYIYNLKISYVSATTIQISTGCCRNGADDYDIELTGTQNVALTTSGANGLDTGAEASNTLYYVWVIEKSSDGTTGGLLSLSDSAPTMPTGYDKKRLIGAIYNDSSSDIMEFQQRGKGNAREMFLDDTVTPLILLNAGGATAFTNVDVSALVPSFSQNIMVRCSFQRTSFGNIDDAFYVRPDGSSAATPPSRIGGMFDDTDPNAFTRVIFPIELSSSQIFEYAVDDVDNDLSLFLISYQFEL